MSTCCGCRDELLGLTHDLNNLMVVVIGLLDTVDHPCEDHAALHVAARRIVHRIRDTEARVTRPPEVAVDLITVDELVDKVREVADSFPFPVTLHIQLSPADRGRLVAYSAYKREVIGTNLLSNWQAAGVTKLHGVVRLDWMHESVAVEIIDNGKGMSAATLAKIRTGPMLGEGQKGKGCQLVRQACAASGRTVSWESIQYVGTKVTLRYRLVESPPESIRTSYPSIPVSPSNVVPISQIPPPTTEPPPSQLPTALPPDDDDDKPS